MQYNIDIQKISIGEIVHGDKINEEIEKILSRRNAIWNDLKTQGSTLSVVSQVILIGEIASLDAHISEMNKELEDMEWNDFISAAWNDLE